MREFFQEPSRLPHGSACCPTFADRQLSSLKACIGASSAWRSAHGGASNVVDVVVSGLRRKLRGHAPALETVRDVGYRCRNAAAHLGRESAR